MLPQPGQVNLIKGPWFARQALPATQPQPLSEDDVTQRPQERSMTARTRCIQIGGRDASRRFEETLVRPIVVPIQLLQIVGGHSAPRRPAPLWRSDRAIEEVV